MEESKQSEVKVFSIPLRKAFRKPRDKRAKYAINLIREFVARHLKIDKEKVKLGKFLNELIWKSPKKPPRRVKVNVTKIEDYYAVELLGKKYEPMKVEKPKEEGLKEKLAQRLGAKAIKKQEEEKLVS